MADNFSFQPNTPSSFDTASMLEQGGMSLLESGSPYSQKLMEAGLSFHDKMLLARQANLYKLANIEGYRTGYIVGSDNPEESTDLDSGLLQDAASGNLYRFRMRHAGNFDTVDTADVVAKSRNKMSYQPEYVAAISGKRVEDLTEFDFKNVKNYQTRQTLDKWQDPDYPDLPYNPNFKYEAPRINNKIPVLYKSTGTGFYGRDLTDMINPATGRSMTFDAASNPYLNSSFQLSDYLNTERNQQRINEFNALPSQPLKDKATQKRVNNLFEQPANNRFSRTFNSKNISMDDIIDKYQADRNDFMEFVDQLGYNVDKAQASIRQTIGHLARALLPSSWIDENYWKSLDKPVNEQGMTLADVISGVDPIQYAIHQRHNKENDAVWDKARGEYEKGNYGMAAVNALNYLRKSIVDVNYLLADSFGQMAASSGGTAAGGALGGIVGGALGGPAGARVGSWLGAFLTGTMITAFDETVMARDQYKEQNNGQDMSPERVLATFGAHMVAAAPEQVLQMIGLKKVLPSKIGNAIFKGEEKIASRASASIPELMSAKGALEAGKQVGKAFLGAGLAEAGQEGFQNFVTAYASQNQENPKSAWEVATDDEQLKAALAGFAMGGAMHGTATGIGVGKSLRAEKAEAVRQENLAQTRQTQTSAGTSANSDASTEAINLANSTAINATTSAADSIKAAQELRNKRGSIYLNIDADEALMRKEAEANVDAARKLHASGASNDEITSQTGLTPQQILSVYAYMSNYNADYAQKHNTRINEHAFSQMQDELYKIADDIGLTREEAKKTLNQVATDIRVGPDGYENYGRKIRMGHEELLRTDLSEDQKKAIKRTTDLYTLKMVNLMANEVTKLNQFAKGLEDIVTGVNDEISVKYPYGGGFVLKGKYLARYDPALKKGAIGVIDDIYDSIKEMESFLTNGQNIPEADMKAAVNRFNGSNKKISLNFDDIEPIKKRVDNAITKIRELGEQEFAPVEAVTDKTIKDYVDRIGKAVKAVQKNKTESIDYTKKVRALTHILYQQNDAYDQLVKGISNSSKLTEEQKAEYTDYLKGLKQATEEHKQKAADIKAEYPGTKKNAQDLIAKYTDVELDKHILKAENASDLEAYTNTTKPLTEIRDSIGKAINAFKSVSTSSKEDAELIEKLSNLYNNVAKRIGNNRTTFNNKNKTTTAPSATAQTSSTTTPSYKEKSPNAFPVLTDEDFNEIFKNTTSASIRTHKKNLQRLIAKKEKEATLHKTEKDPNTIAYLRSLKARLELVEKWENTVNPYVSQKEELKSEIDVKQFGGSNRRTNSILTAISDGQLDKIEHEINDSIKRAEKELKISNQKGEKNEGASANIEKEKNNLKLIKARREELHNNPRIYRKNRSGTYVSIPFQLTDEDKVELRKLGDQLIEPYKFVGLQSIIKDLFKDIEVEKGVVLDTNDLAYSLSSEFVSAIKDKKLTNEQAKNLKNTIVAAIKAIASPKGELSARLKDVEEMYGKQINKKHIISEHLLPLLSESLTLLEGKTPASVFTSRTKKSSTVATKPVSSEIVDTNEQEAIKNDTLTNLWANYYNDLARIKNLNKVKNRSKQQQSDLSYYAARSNLIKQEINNRTKELDNVTETKFSKLSDTELKNQEKLVLTTLKDLRAKEIKGKLVTNDKIDKFTQLIDNEIDLPIIRRELAIRKARSEGKPIVKPTAKPTVQSNNQSNPSASISTEINTLYGKYDVKNPEHTFTNTSVVNVKTEKLGTKSKWLDKDKTIWYVYGGRNSTKDFGELGNPYPVGPETIQNRKNSIEKCWTDSEWIKRANTFINKLKEFKKQNPQLKQVVFGCYCAPKACHLDLVAKRVQDEIFGKAEETPKPAEKPAETASPKPIQAISEKAPESSETKGNGQDRQSQGEAQQTSPTASQGASKGSQETAVSKAGEGYVLHSGGADGSDIAWSTVAKDLGLNITSNHYYIGKKGPKNAPNGNIELDKSFIAEAMPYIEGAAKVMGKNVPTNQFVKQLIARNWMQVKSSDGIFAISNGWFKGRTQEIVDGGTGWAVQMAINEAEEAEINKVGSSKPIYVFDMPTNTWYKFNVSNYTANYTNQWFEPIDYIPTLTKNFAGIGTRDLKEDGKKAIKAVYEATFGKFQAKTKEEPRSEQNQPSQPDASNTPKNAPRIDQKPSDGQSTVQTQQVPENGTEGPKSGSQEEVAPWSDTLPPGVQEAPQTMSQPQRPAAEASQPIPMPKREDFESDEAFAAAILKWTTDEAARKSAEDQAIRDELADVQGNFTEANAETADFNPSLVDTEIMQGPYNPEGDTSEKGQIINTAKEAIITVDSSKLDPTKISKKQVKLNDKLVDIYIVDKKLIKNGIYGYDENWNLYLAAEMLNPNNVKNTLKLSNEVLEKISSSLQEYNIIPDNKNYNDIIDNMSNLELIRAIVRYAERESQHAEHAKEKAIMPNAFALDTALYVLYKAAVISKDPKISTYKQPDLTDIYHVVQTIAIHDYTNADPAKTNSLSPNYLYALGDFATAEMIANSYKDTKVNEYATYQLHNTDRLSATVVNTPNQYVSKINEKGITKNSKGEDISYLRRQIRMDKSDCYIAINPAIYTHHLDRRRVIYQEIGLTSERSTMFTSPQPSKDKDGNYTGTYRSRLDNSPHIRLLYDIIEDGSNFAFGFNETTLAVTDFSFIEFVAGSQFSRFMNPNNLSDTEVCNMFGLNAETASVEEKIEARELLRTQGVPKTAMANTIGRMIMDNLGIRANYDQGYAEVWERMASGLGAFALDFGEKYGLYKFNEFTPENGEYEWLESKSLKLIKSTEQTIPLANNLREQYLGTSTVGKGAHLANGLNRFKREDSESNDVPVFNTPPVLDKERVTYVHNTKQDLPLSKKQLKVIDRAQHQAYQFDLDIVDYMLEHEADIAARLGYIPTDHNPLYDDMGFEARESALGVNNGIARQFEALKMYAPKQKDLMSVNEFKGIFFKCFITKNARFSINSSTLNPQNQKLHRFCCLPIAAWKTYNINFERDSDEWHAENFAIAQAFDMLGNREKYLNFAEKMKELSKDDLIKMRDYLVTRSDSQFALTCLREFKIDDIGIESIPQCLNALQHLIRRQEAIEQGKSSYVSSLFCEDDSTTSGYAINFLNAPLESITDAGFLNKVGVFMFVNNELQAGKIQLTDEQKKSLDFTMDELKKVKGFVDIYKTSGIGASKRLIGLEENDNEKLRQAFINKIKQNIKSKVEATVKKQNKDLPEEQLKKKINDEIEATATKEAEFMLTLFDKLRPALPAIKPNGDIDSNFRNLVKYPTMYFGYSAGAKKISTEIAYNLMDETINTYLAVHRQVGTTVKEKVENYLINHLGYRNDDVLKATMKLAGKGDTKEAKDKNNLEAMSAKAEQNKKEDARKKALAVYDAISFIEENNKQYRGKDGKIKNSTPLATRLKENLTSKTFVARSNNPDAYKTTFMHMFNMLIGTTYGDSIGEVLENQFRHYVCKNNMMIWMSSTMARLYIDRRNKAIDDARLKDPDKRGEITYQQIREIEADLLKKGVTPYTTLASNTSDNDARILLYKSKRITDPINEVQDYTAQTDEDGNVKNTLTSTVYADVREPTTPGRAGAVLPTHGMDGDSIMDTYLEFTKKTNEHEAMGLTIIHDAVGMSPLDQIQVVKYYCNNLMTTAHNHDIFGTMYGHFMRCIEAAKAVSADPDAIDNMPVLNDNNQPVYAEEFDKHLRPLGSEGASEEHLKFVSTPINPDGTVNTEDKEPTPVTIGMLIEKGKIWKDLISKRRDWLFSHKLFCVNMGGCRGCSATFDATSQSNGEQAFKDADKEYNSEGSHSDGFKTDGEINTIKTQAIDNAEARVDLLDDIHSMSVASDNTTCSEAHMNNLRSFIKLVKPEAFKDVITELIDNGLYNAGLFTYKPTGNSTIQIILDSRQNIDPFTKVAVESYLLSPEEIYGHEIVHAAMHPAFENAGVFGYHREITMLQHIYKEAANVITWQDLMPEDGTYDPSLKAQYEKYVKDTYKYIFDNPDYKHNRGLREFCAYAVSSEKFQKLLKDKLSAKYNEKQKATKLIDKLIDLIKNIFKVFFSKTKFREVFGHAYNVAKGLEPIKQKNMYDQLMLLINQMALADTKASNKLMQHSKKTLEHMFSLLGSLVNRYNRPLGQWLKKHTIELADTKDWFDLPERLLKINGSFLDKAKLYASCIALYPISKRHRKAWRSLLTNLLGISQQGILLSTIRDITKPDYDSSSLELLSVKNRELDGLYKSIEFNVREELKEHFGRDLTEPEEIALTTVLLRTDIQSLYDGKNIDYIINLIKDPEFVYNEIDRLDAEISKLYSKRDDYNWVMGQCVGLARYMVTGKGNEQLNMTARGIATGYYYDKVLPYTKESEELINKLATLFALKHTSEDQKKIAATLPKNGFEHFLKMHQEFVAETTEGVKIDDENPDKRTKIIERIHIAKGYTKQLLDTTYETQINFTDTKTQREMSKLGYTLFFKINPDAVTQREEPIGIYKRFGIPKRRDGAAASLQGYDAIGTSLTNMSYWDMDKEEALEAITNEERRQSIVEIYKKNADVISDRLRRRMKGAPMTFEDFDRFSSGFSPIASPTREFGDYSDYRVTMSYANKRVALGLNEKGIDVLSKMYASISKKAQSSMANKALLEFLYDYMDKHMDSGTHRKINDVTQKFVEISDITDNKYLKDAWRVLPKEFKEAIKKRPLWVRDDWLQDLFGVSNMSLNDTKFVKKIPYKWVKRFISIAEYIMKTIAYYRKEAIILKIPAVLIGNLVSNFMYSVANHANPVKVFKLTLANAKAIREYLDTKKELNRIILKQRIGTATNEELSRKNILKANLQSNIVHPLMEKGMYQSIVEDMNPEELESTSKITKLLKYNKLAEKTPGMLKTALNHLYLGKGTPIHDFMFTATQYSDFIARATEYQLRMAKAKSEYERIKKEKPTIENAQFKLMNYDEFYKAYEKITSIRVLNAFINYDKPQSQLEQYLNDVGLLFFSKFGKRIQHVITDQLWENPLGAVMFLLSQKLLIDTEDIFEQNLFQKNWSALVSNPISNFLGIAMPMPLQFATGQQDPW